MADISARIKFSAAAVEVIEQKIKDPNFTYHAWGEPDLLIVRTEARNFYRDMQNGYCAYCRKDVSIRSANNCHVEHIAPKSIHHNFIFTPENLCVICADCDEIKRAQETIFAVPDTVVPLKNSRVRYPRATSAFQIIHPHFDVYLDHILMVGKFYVDKTDKGSFTIRVCDLNKRLKKFGWEIPMNSDDELSGLMMEFLGSSNPAFRRRKIRELRDKLIWE